MVAHKSANFIEQEFTTNPSNCTVDPTKLDFPTIPQIPNVDEIHLFGQLDRNLSDMKYIVDHPASFDESTLQTLKHHVEDMEALAKYIKGKLDAIKSFPPTKDQRDRGY